MKMKKKIKTYSVAGMMEYQTLVRIGKNSTKINFTGGSISNGCTQPARFSTKNLIIQNAIEGSDEFKRGRIRLERAIDLNEEIIVEKPDPKMHNAQSRGGGERRVETPDRIGESKETGAEAPAQEQISEMDEATGEPEAIAEPEATVESEAETGSLTEVEVSCKDIAKQYLADHYGERPAPLRTWVDVQACAAKYGITFKSPTLE